MEINSNFEPEVIKSANEDSLLKLSPDLRRFLIDIEPQSFLEQHEKVVKKNMDDLMKFMRN